jgi:hypothetical protein
MFGGKEAYISLKKVPTKKEIKNCGGAFLTTSDMEGFILNLVDFLLREKKPIKIYIEEASTFKNMDEGLRISFNPLRSYSYVYDMIFLNNFFCISDSLYIKKEMDI